MAKKKGTKKGKHHSWILYTYLYILLAILVAFIIFMGICIIDGREIDHANTALGICGVLATIVIGLNIFNYVEFREVERKVKTMNEKYDRLHINSTDDIIRLLSEQCRADGDHSRMNAFFLKELGKPIWGIGWLCRAVKQYYKCCTELELNEISYVPISESCPRILMACIKKFTEKADKEKINVSKDDFLAKYERENDEENIEVFKRTLKDFVDYLTIVNGNTPADDKKSKLSVYQENLIKNIKPTKEEKEVLTLFLAFLTGLLDKDDNIEKCKKDSRFKDAFDKEIKVARSICGKKDMQTIFDELRSKA